LYGTWSTSDAGALLEEFTGEMSRAAHTGRRIRQLAALLLGQRHEIRERLRRHTRMHHEHVGEHDAHCDRRDVALRIVSQVLHDMRRDGHRADRCEVDRVSVGRRRGDVLGCDVSAGACLVVDDDRLPEVLAELLRDDPGRGIGAATGGKAYGQRDGATRKALPADGSCDNHCRRCEHCSHRELHPDSPNRSAW
jgi:hypothetical protein